MSEYLLQKIREILERNHNYVYSNKTSDGDVIASQTGQAIVLKRIYFNNASTVAGSIALKEGSGGSTIANVTLAEIGGSFCLDFGRGYVLPSDTSLYADLTTVNNVNLMVFYEVQ